ncbi:MAG: ABC transporter permease [Chthoniobacteraceae bacterium]
MKLPFSLFLALRYLKPKRTFVSVITVLSVLGVALGITCLIVVIAVMSGFDQELRKHLVGFEPHLRVSSAVGPIQDWEALQERLEKENPSFQGVSPYMMGPILLEFDNNFTGATLRGIQPNGELKLVDMRKFIVPGGRYELDSEKCIMGRELAASLGVHVGDKISLHGPGNLTKVAEELKRLEKEDPNAKNLKEIRSLVRPTELEVVGLFDSGVYQFDAGMVIVALSVAQEIYDFENAVHGISIRTPDPDWAERYRVELAKKLGPEYTVTSWMDADRTRLDAVVQERVMMTFILMMIIVVAAFSISNTLITVIVQKKREIGVIKALGASPAQIIRIFVGQGFVVGVFGNVCGLLLAWGALAWRNEARQLIIKFMHRDLFPAAVYQLTGIPSAITAKDILIICGTAMIICILSAYIPARFAAKLDPVKALREE